MISMIAEAVSESPAGWHSLTVGAGAIAAIGVAAHSIIAAVRARRADRARVKLEEPVPEIPVKRVYSPPSYFQHRELERRVERVEGSLEIIRGEHAKIRQEQAEQFRLLLQAGDARADRLADKLDKVARALHARIDTALFSSSNNSES